MRLLWPAAWHCGALAQSWAEQPATKATASKAPVPTKSVQDAARKEVDEVYGEPISKAKIPAQQSQIADEMRRDALATDDKPAAQFVLLRTAIDLAVQAGDPDTALQAIDELAARFKVKRSAMRADAVLKAAKTTRSTARQALLTQAFQVAEELDGQQDFATARRLYDFAVDEAKAHKNPTLVKQATRMREESARLAKAFQAVQDARSVLKENPDDPPANQTVGAFCCFVQGDWAAGLPLLALASDKGLKSLAARDLESADLGIEQQIQLADDWWAAAEKRADAPSALQSRAAYWYRRALPATTGLVKLKIEKRLATLPSADPPPAEAAPSRTDGVRLFRFADRSSLADFAIKGAAKIEDPVEDLPRDSELWQIVDGELRIRSLGQSKSTQVILTQPYDSIAELSIKGRIVPPHRNNFRFEIGRHRFIFNWEREDKNLVLVDSNITHQFAPAVTPGKVHTFAVKQAGSRISVSVDGEQVVEFDGQLKGEVKFRAEEGTTIGIQSLSIDGKGGEKSLDQRLGTGGNRP